MIFFIIISILLGSTVSHHGKFGICPTIPAEANFNMTKFEGIWYVVEDFHGDIAPCQTWTITKGDKDNTWKVLQTQGDSGVRGAIAEAFDSPRFSEYPKAIITGTTARMNMEWTKDLAERTLTIHKTDYTSYASAFECQTILLGNRQNALVMSRKPTLDDALSQRIKIKDADIDITKYKTVNQTSCDVQSRFDDTIFDGVPPNSVFDWVGK